MASVRKEAKKKIATALPSYTSAIVAVQKAAGGRSFGTRGKITASVGNAPNRVGISEWDSLEQVQAYLNSAAFKNLAPQRDKVVKSIRAFAIDASTN